MCWACHPERSEGSLKALCETLRSAQSDNLDSRDSRINLLLLLHHHLPVAVPFAFLVMFFLLHFADRKARE
jgi:hypothetical protein